VERLPEQRGEGEQEVAAQAAPAAVQSALGVDVGQPASLDAASVLALQRSAGNAAVTALMPDAPAPAVGDASNPAASTDRPVAAESSVQRALARSVLRRGQPLQRGDEQAAEASAPQPGFRSAALVLRSKLRSGGSVGRAMLHRAITTSGGEWDTDKYDLLKDVDGAGKAVPAAQGTRGLDITLKFKPNDLVDAELIGLTQSVQAFVAGAPNLTPAAATRAIPAGDAKAANTGAGETDEGTAIDQLGGINNPIYPASKATSGSLTDTNAKAVWGQEGWHYKDKANKVRHKDATLIDQPMRSGAQKDSRHIFETTALATKGVQAGTYYGSVRWGWRTDGTEAFTKIPLQKVSDGVPSATFLKAAGIWNAGKSSTGADTVDLPIPDVKVTTGPVTLVMPVPMVDIALPVGTRLQIVQDLVGPVLNGRVKVVDGPHTGMTGDVSAAEWSNIDDERA
jgi:hypothetical protein